MVTKKLEFGLAGRYLLAQRLRKSGKINTVKLLRCAGVLTLFVSMFMIVLLSDTKTASAQQIGHTEIGKLYIPNIVYKSRSAGGIQGLVYSMRNYSVTVTSLVTTPQSSIIKYIGVSQIVTKPIQSYDVMIEDRGFDSDADWSDYANDVLIDSQIDSNGVYTITRHFAQFTYRDIGERYVIGVYESNGITSYRIGLEYNGHTVTVTQNTYTKQIAETNPAYVAIGVINSIKRQLKGSDGLLVASSEDTE